MSEGNEVRERGAGDEGAGEEHGAGRSLLTPERLERYKERLVDTAILGLPIAAINWGLGKVSGTLTSQPWHILWFIAPLAVAAWMLWRGVMRSGSLRVRGAMLLFLICYLSIFALASASDLLVWRRAAVTLEEGELPRNWLLPAGWGDWRYWFARRPPGEPRLLVVTMEEPVERTRVEVRFELARLIRLAANNGARGIAFDFYFGRESSLIDEFLCQVVGDADIDVITGYPVVKGETGLLYAEPYAATIEECIPDERRGHLVAYRDADGVIRHVVLRVRDIEGSAALSLAAAASLAGSADSLAMPAGNLLQFVEPQGGVPTLAYERFVELPPEELAGVLDRRFLLVGERSEAETFQTPFGARLGVQVHAAAIGSLLSGSAIQRPPWWSGLLIIFVACYLITALAASGMPASKVALVTLAVSACIVAGSILAMRLWNVWLDVIYALLAVWLLPGLLLAVRGKLAGGSAAGGG